jgi:hypothetical protein
MAKDHYIPQFYLINYEIRGRTGWVYSYRRGMKPLPKAIRSIACEEDYYDLKTVAESLPVDNFDRLLRLTEESTSPVITELLKAPSFSLTEKQFTDLRWFISLMGFRTPLSRESLAAFTREWTDKEFKAFAADKKGFDSLGGGASEDPALRESARQALLNGDLILNLKRGGETEDFLMARQLEQASTFADILAYKKWHLIESDCSRVFMTSDHPVVLLPSPHHTPGMRVGNVDGWFILPLSPKRALLLANDRLGDKVMPIKREKMIEYQWYITTRCHLSVFSHLRSMEFQETLDQTAEGEILQTIFPNNWQTA